MAASFRIRHPNGTSTLSCSLDDSLLSFQCLLSETTGIPSSSQELRSGFPPKSLDTTRSIATLQELGLRNGDVVIVASNGNAPASATMNPADIMQTTQAPVSPAPKSVKKAKGRPHAATRVEGGYLVLRVVPDDNSCLFTAASLVLAPGITPTQIRQVVADAIRSDPAEWNELVLGRAPSDYISHITKPNSWGGAVELAVLSKHFATEIASVDVATGRIDRFGESAGYDNRVLLLYSGIHYDAVTLSHSNEQSTFPHNLEFDQTQFPTSDDSILVGLMKIADTLKKEHYYTDTASFTLKCETCKAGLKGEKEARQHAESTGHTNFGEY